MSLQLEKKQDFPLMVKAKAPSRSAGGGPEPSGGSRMAQLFLCGRGKGAPAGAMGCQPARTKKEPEQKTFCSGGPPPCRYAARLLCRCSVLLPLTYLKLITDLS